MHRPPLAAKRRHRAASLAPYLTLCLALSLSGCSVALDHDSLSSGRVPLESDDAGADGEAGADADKAQDGGADKALERELPDLGDGGAG